MSIRINKYFTEQGYCSRREADKLVESGRVKINGKKAVMGDQVDVERGDAVTLDEKPISFKNERVYLMYHKPRGITCTTERKIEGNIIDAVNYPTRIFPIGRLDKDSSGLIFLTNDGDIVNEILRAEHGHEKEYIVTVMKDFDDSFLGKMSNGVDIGDHKTLPCKIKRLSSQSFSIILTEGKNRQIRRMCEALNSRVKTLKRIRIMNIQLGDLKEGTWKEIPTTLLNELKESLHLPPASSGFRF